MMNEAYLKPDERAMLSLRSLYRGYGYLPFKMSKFEEYDLYVKNKDFLVSDRIITFTDVSGKLLALKPDVTLSIIKNGEDAPGCKQKVYYNETVYRAAGASHRIKEIMQTGIECIGDVDMYDICEVVTLAAASLSSVSPDFVLDIAHLGILSAILDDISPDAEFRRKVAVCMAERNPHDLARACAEAGIGKTDTALLLDFVSIHGDMDGVIKRLSPIVRRHPSASPALERLSFLRDHLKATPFANRIRFDFSIINDMNYYNGIVFCGFLDGICEGVLSGGQYNKLMQRMGRRSGAIGFALYLDLLESLDTDTPVYDVDVLLLYDKSASPAAVAAEVARLRENGQTVSAQCAVPERLRYASLINFKEEGKR